MITNLSFRFMTVTRLRPISTQLRQHGNHSVNVLEWAIHSPALTQFSGETWNWLSIKLETVVGGASIKYGV